MKHGGRIAPSLFFVGRWIAKCRCGWICIGPLRALRKAAREHVEEQMNSELRDGAERFLDSMGEEV